MMASRRTAVLGLQTWRGAATAALLLAILSGCAVQNRKLEPEEAGFLHEQGGLIAAACRIGQLAHISGGPSLNGILANRSPLFNRPHKDSLVSDLHCAYTLFHQTQPDWTRALEGTEQLLAPGSLAGVREALLTALRAQLHLDRARDDTVRWFHVQEASKLACIRHAEFQQLVSERVIGADAPVWGLTYRPPGSPIGLSVNTNGVFTIMASQTIDTPIGSFTVAASEAFGSSKRLIIQDGETRRVLLLDRPFRVFVPASHGVNVTNTADALILEVVPRPAV